jgi:hypothetical protein
MTEEYVGALVYDQGTPVPSLDLGQPIVRCRDCKCFSVDNSDHEYRTGWWCKRWYTDMVEPTGYCAWGVRRVGE